MYVYGVMTHRRIHCLASSGPRFDALQGGSMPIRHHDEFGYLLICISEGGLEINTAEELYMLDVYYP